MPARAPLFAALIAAVVLRVLFFVGIQGSDDISYNRSAHAILNGTYDLRDPESVHGRRFAVVLPLAFLQKILGAGEVTGCLPSLASSLAILVLLYAALRPLSERAAAIAAFAWAILPINVLYSTTAFPDLVQAAFAFAGFLVATRETTLRRAFLGGLLFGLSWMAKETAVYWVAVAGVWLAWRRQWKFAAALCAGAAVIPAAEMLMYAAFTGDPLCRIHSIQRSYLRDLDATFYPTAASIVKRLTVEFPLLLFNPLQGGNLALVFLPFAAATAGLLRRRDMRVTPWLFLAAGLALCYDFWPARLVPFTPNTVLHRYLVPLCIPAVAVIAVAADALLSARPRVGRATLAFLALLQLPSLWIGRYHMRYEFNGVRELQARVWQEKGRIYSDWRTTEALAYLSGYALDVWFIHDREPDARPGDVAVLNRPWLRVWPPEGAVMKRLAAAPPAEWRRIERIPVPPRRRLRGPPETPPGEIEIYRIAK